MLPARSISDRSCFFLLAFDPATFLETFLLERQIVYVSTRTPALANLAKKRY